MSVCFCCCCMLFVSARECARSRTSHAVFGWRSSFCTMHTAPHVLTGRLGVSATECLCVAKSAIESAKKRERAREGDEGEISLSSDRTHRRKKRITAHVLFCCRFGPISHSLCLSHRDGRRTHLTNLSQMSIHGAQTPTHLHPDYCKPHRARFLATLC